MHSCCLNIFGVARASCLAVLLLNAQLTAQTCTSTELSAGYRDFDYTYSPVARITAEKPEHKLWYHDGFWWGSLWDPAVKKYRIHRLDLANQCWQATGPDIDNRRNTLADALWDGQKLYIASHTRQGSAGPARLYRYSYDAMSQAWNLDSEFPVMINDVQSETLTIAKDSTGKLWITWAEPGRIMVNCSTGEDAAWGIPFELPLSGTNVLSDDISAIIAFDGNKVGIMWSNQADAKMFFAVHNDGDPDTDWSLEVAFSDPGPGNAADDHINLKIASDGSGKVYAVTKTGLKGPNAPLIVLLERAPDGSWTWHQVWDTEDKHTRAILLIDEENRELYVVAPRLGKEPNIVYMKKTSLDQINFSDGWGTEFLKSDLDTEINDPTSTRQPVNSTTGLLVLASDKGTRRYLHNYLAIARAKPGEAPGQLTATVSGDSTIDLAWDDRTSNEDGFEIERKASSTGTFATIATIGPNRTSFRDTVQAFNTTYFYRVRAYNTSCVSAYSNEANATPVRYGLQISRAGSDIMLNWNAVAEADSYVVYRAMEPMFSADTARLAVTTAASYTDASILGDPDTNHFYRMRAFAFGTPLALSKRVGEFEFLLLAPEGKKNNLISLCLNDSGLQMASDLAAHIGATCDLISQWQEGSQAWSSYVPGVPAMDFALSINEIYMVSVTAQDTLCLLGEVPQRHQYGLITTGGKNNNGMMLLMDTDTITTASALALDIGPVDLISRWVAASQAYASYVPGVPSTDFAIFPGMPLMVSVTQDVIWPSRPASEARKIPLSGLQPELLHSMTRE